MTHEHVDAIPLLVGILQEWHLPALVDACLGGPPEALSLSYGLTVIVWLTYILTADDHRKTPVAAWVADHQETCTRLLGVSVQPSDFNEVRLSQVLRRLSQDPHWHALETGLFGCTVQVDLPAREGIRLDASTTLGYHVPHEGGLLQFGHSKDHRPDLAQIKVMAAATAESGQLLALDVWPGQTADDPCYTPLIARVRALVGETGLLFVGDNKMSALATRAEVVAHGDDYLMPLAQTHETAEQWEAWITAGLQSGSALHPIVDAAGTLLAWGYETTRPLTACVAGRRITWTERVLVTRSVALQQQQADALQDRLTKAMQAITALTPPVGPGRRQVRTEAALQTAIDAILQRYRVGGLLRITWRQEVYGRGPLVRYQITAVYPDEAAVRRQRARLGWRVLVTSRPAATLPLAAAVRRYRGAWSLEQLFHRLKDRPLGIAPLWVRRDDQVAGLTRLLALAVRVQVALETALRQGLARRQQPLAGLYPERPQRTTMEPTLRRVVEGIRRAEITLTRYEIEHEVAWHLTPLPAWVQLVLDAIQLSPSWYQRVGEDSA